MTEHTDFSDYRRRAATMTAADLIAVAESLAWTLSVARRTESVLRKPGRRTLVIPNAPAPAAVRDIIAALEADAARGGE